jgi:predicted nucleic acid-binding protein
VIYLDTGCFVKLYYPEADTAKVIALIQGQPICYTPLHEAGQHTSLIGCRSLDVLHCAAAKILGVSEFITTDGRQKKLAAAMGLNPVTF